MPGLANMQQIPSQVDAVSSTPALDINLSQPNVKDEDDDKDDFLLDNGIHEDEHMFKPRPQLRQPGTFMRTLGFFIKGMEQKIIDVEPEYQREVVWTAERMSGLIDSLMENYYIPPVILNKKTQSDNGSGTKHTFICVDGKQRLSSVRCFVEGLIPCHDQRGEKWWFRDAASGRRRKILPEEVQKEFLDKEFVSFEYKDLSSEQEEDLFARVQMGVQLTLAEKMRASTGPWQELARCYVTDFPVIYSLLKDRSRAKDFQMTLSCFSQIIEVQHPTAANGIPILKTNHTSLPKLLGNKGAVDDGLKSHLAGVWKTFQDLIELDPNTFTNVERRLKGVQTFAPVEMVAVTVLISMYSETRNNRLLIGDIRALRDALRDAFVDLRLNSNVWKFVWDFIDNLEQIRGAVDGSTVDRSANAIPTAKVSVAPSTVVQTAPKRGRPTARTKPLTALPGGSNPLPDKTKHQPSPSPHHPRSPKRQRIDPGPASTSPHFSSPAIAAPSIARFIPPKHLSTGLSREDPVVLDEPSKPAPFSANSRSLPKSAKSSPVVPQELSQATSSSQSTVQKAQKVQHGKRSKSIIPPASASNPVPTQSPLPTPPEARQNRIAELNSYRAPTALMGTMASATSCSQPVPMASTSTAPLGLPAMPAFFDGHSWSLPSRAVPPSSTSPAASSSTLRAMPPPSLQALPHFTASGPVRPPPQSVEVMQTASPAEVRRARLTLALAQDRYLKASARSLPQYDGAIDLTEDDVEQERQDLLSSFRATASAAHQPRHPLGNTIPSSPLQDPSRPSNQAKDMSGPSTSKASRVRSAVPQQPRPAVVEDLTTDEEPVEYINPYQRLKQRKQMLGAPRS